MDMMTKLTEWMQSVMLPTHQIASDISARLTALDGNVGQLDLEWRKEVAEARSVLTSLASGAQLHALIDRGAHAPCMRCSRAGGG